MSAESGPPAYGPELNEIAFDLVTPIGPYERSRDAQPGLGRQAGSTEGHARPRNVRGRAAP